MAKSSKSESPATIAARLSGFLDGGSGGVVPPMQPSTTFARDEDYQLLVEENSYGRDDNDQVRLVEEVLCALEQGAESLLFSSGMAAISTLVSYLRAGDLLLAQEGIYWGTTSWVRRFCERRAIELIEADSADASAFSALIKARKPKMVLVEVPSNPWIKLTDVEAVAEACREVGSILAVDATAATPVLLKPIRWGADIVIHSATKAINGHSDVLAGVLTSAEAQSDLWQFIKAERHDAGAVLAPQAAWLLARGIRTLALRIEKMCANALTIATHLEKHPRIKAVWYPGLSSYAQYELGNRLMSNGSGYLLSFLVDGDRATALEFCRHLKGIHRATSLGGTESLVEHRHTIEGALTGCPENLIRLSVGIEDVQDLISELGEALAHI